MCVCVITIYVCLHKEILHSILSNLQTKLFGIDM